MLKQVFGGVYQLFACYIEMKCVQEQSTRCIQGKADQVFSIPYKSLLVLYSGGEQGLQDKGGLEALLLRFLRAEKYNVPKAEKRLREHAGWRKVFFLNGSISQVVY